jgi:hypothetical protein
MIISFLEPPFGQEHSTPPLNERGGRIVVYTGNRKDMALSVTFAKGRSGSHNDVY